MNIEKIINVLRGEDVQFFVGVPDSRLKPLCDYLTVKADNVGEHIIAANEGNAVSIAAGYHLATGKIPCVYMQNSGLGNAINPIVSLLSDNVYAIPVVFIIGWRGEPNEYDEPQHVFQGAITLKLLSDIGIEYRVLERETKEQDILEAMNDFRRNLDIGRSVAFVVKKGSLEYGEEVVYKNVYCLRRETILASILKYAVEDIIVSTTGKTAREIFRLREENQQSHKFDFLTVGSMGHSSSIALGIALNKPNKRVWCIDGDGAALMHLGAMATIGAKGPENLIHVIINNEAHESVGGHPTVAGSIDFGQIAFACGYKKHYTAKSTDELYDILEQLNEARGPVLIEMKVAIGSREDLGRPTLTPGDSKKLLMNYLNKTYDVRIKE